MEKEKEQQACVRSTRSNLGAANPSKIPGKRRINNGTHSTGKRRGGDAVLSGRGRRAIVTQES